MFHSEQEREFGELCLVRALLITLQHLMYYKSLTGTDRKLEAITTSGHVLLRNTYISVPT
jgi:hypothetical protein